MASHRSDLNKAICCMQAVTAGGRPGWPHAGPHTLRLRLEPSKQHYRMLTVKLS